MFFRLLTFIIFCLTIVFIFQNLNEVTVYFFNISFTGPFSLSIAVAMVGGFLAGIFFMLPSLFRRRKELKKVLRENVRLNKKVSESAIEFNVGDRTPAENTAYGEIE